MKQTALAALALVACALPCPILAQPTILDPTVALLPAYTHTTADDVVSYDWSSSNDLYYMTSAGFPDVNVWKSSGASLLNIYANPNNFAGSSVVAIGNYIYFDDSDRAQTQYIRKYGPLSGTPATTLASTTFNNGLFGHDGALFIGGANGFGPGNIYYSTLGANGNLVTDPARSLGQTGSPSGPLAFDLAGNLYYAPGYSDPDIYKFSAAEVAAAINQLGTLTVTGHQWLDYSTLYTVDGVTSMLIDPHGDLLLTLTNFSSPSFLAKFGVAANGSYNATTEKVLSATDRLGEIRLHNNNVYISSGNAIYEIVPEPGAGLLLLFTGGLFGGLVRRRLTRAAAPSPGT